ncbi:hypothetical protein TsFJ059_009378 [Trichoderma semiorbis]|uniref:Uncharacterized protein n=1 Tax=Trichoderma semiorbis TaxID=1491008 RepID=A0A9P8HE61_9HYPO|nr:hypothetical protein TsFJ059_009378 [Trichoderma semiorbis]
MRWSASILSSLVWLLATQRIRCLEEDESSPLNKTLWRRVRDPGGDGGGQTPTISDLFLIGDSSLKGGCSSKLDVLNEWLNEVNLLHEAAKTVYGGYRTNKNYAVLLFDFFGFGIEVNGKQGDPSNTYGIKNMDNYFVEENWKMLGDRLAGVSQFLAGAGLRDPVVPGEPPRIFCSGEAAELAGLGDIVKDKSQNEVVTARDPDTNEPTEYLTISRAFRPSGSNIFWMSAYNGYLNLKKYTPDDNQACPVNKVNADGSGGTRYAITNKGTRPVELYKDIEFGNANRVILFCPAAFEPDQWVAGAAGNLHNYPSLAQAISPDNYPGNGGTLDNLGLDNILPVSATFYHELYHLTDIGDTADPYYKMKDIFNAARGTGGLAVPTFKNPETFTMFAMAAYMLINAPEGMDAMIYYQGRPMKASLIPY